MGTSGMNAPALEEGTVYELLARRRSRDGPGRETLHREAKEMGRSVFYAQYRTMVCTVERHHLSDLKTPPPRLKTRGKAFPGNQC